MKRELASIATLVGTLAMATFAHAADEAKYPDSEGYGWSGLYVGIGGGAGVGIGEIDVPSLFNLNGISGEGLLGEVTVGYDFMASDRVLFGVFADGFIDNIATTVDYNGAEVAKAGAEYGFDVGGRVGYMVTPNTLGYVLGGYSWAHFNAEFLGASIYDWDNGGWFVGAGMETAVGRNLTLKGEYRYTQYSGWDFTDIGAPPGGVDLEISSHTFRVGLNYHFNQGSGTGFAPIDRDWTGVYLVGFGGASGLEHDLEFDFGAPFIGELAGLGAEGIFGGGGIGYDKQFGDKWVAGIEASATYGNVATTLSIPGIPANASVDADYSFDVVGRLGVKPSSDTLVYALGGYSNQHFDVNVSGMGSIYDWHAHGFVVGGGVEAAVDEKSAVGLEYRYSDYITEEPVGPGFGVNPTAHSARLTYKYKFF